MPLQQNLAEGCDSRCFEIDTHRRQAILSEQFLRVYSIGGGGSWDTEAFVRSLLTNENLGRALSEEGRDALDMAETGHLKGFCVTDPEIVCNGKVDGKCGALVTKASIEPVLEPQQ